MEQPAQYAFNVYFPGDEKPVVIKADLFAIDANGGITFQVLVGNTAKTFAVVSHSAYKYFIRSDLDTNNAPPITHP
jgi:hypothetical protein